MLSLRFLFISLSLLLGLQPSIAQVAVPNCSYLTLRECSFFLNRAAVNDLHHLYDEKMATMTAPIFRKGNPGNYSYEINPGDEEKPAFYVDLNSEQYYIHFYSPQEALPMETSDDELKLNQLVLKNESSQAAHGSEKSSYEILGLGFFGVFCGLVGGWRCCTNRYEEERDVNRNIDVQRIISEKNSEVFSENKSGNSFINEKENGLPYICAMNKIVSSNAAEESILPAAAPNDPVIVSNGQLDEISVKQVSPKPGNQHRFGLLGGFETLHSDGTWKQTERFIDDDEGNGTWRMSEPSPLLDQVITGVHSRIYNRSDEIDKKIIAYKEKRNASPAKSEEYKIVTSLIEILEKARRRQDASIRHYYENNSTIKNPNSTESVIVLREIEALNEKPNKIELLAIKAERNYACFETCKQRIEDANIEIAKIEKEIVISENDLVPELRKRLSELKRAMPFFDESMALHADCIKLENEQATLLPLPFEKKTKEATEQIQQAIEKIKKTCLQSDIAAQQKYLNAEEIVCKTYYSLNFNNSHIYVESLAEEVQQERPNEQVIDLYLQCLNFSTQSVVAQQRKGQYAYAQALKGISSNLSSAICEIKREEPRKEIIHWNLKAAEFFQKSVAAYDLGQKEKADYLSSAGSCFSHAANELTIAKSPLKLSVELLLEAADFYQQAAATDLGHAKKREYLNNAATAVVLEARNHPLENKETTKLSKRAAVLHQEAAAACDRNEIEKARLLNNAGLHFSKLIKELNYRAGQDGIAALRERATRAEKRALAADATTTYYSDDDDSEINNNTAIIDSDDSDDD